MTEEYSSYGSYAPVYTAAVDAIYSSGVPLDRARQTEKVLRAYAEHASPIGTCYPGLRRIMERTHYSQTTVMRALDVLADLDYMRLHVETSAVRRTQYITYQISPRVLFISRDHIQAAEQLWSTTSLRCNVIIHAQPSPEQAFKPATATSISKPESEPPTPPSTTRKKETRQVREKQREAQQQREAQNKGQELPDKQRNAPSATLQKDVPPPPDLRLCRSPLADDRLEKLSQELKSETNTRISQARQLTMQFGYDEVRNGLAWLKEERKHKQINSEFGLLSWWLHQGAILPDEDTPKPKSLLPDWLKDDDQVD